MSRLNAAMLEIFLEKGIDLAGVIEIAWAMEGGRPVPATPPSGRIHRMNSVERHAAYDRVADRDGHCCAECGRQPRTIWRAMGVNGSISDGDCFTKVCPTSNLELDHIEPLWSGGDNELDNLWLLCVDCHKAKTAREARSRRKA